MTRFYFPSLIAEQKWHTASRNVQVGDIVMVQDSNALRGEWRLARISRTYPSSDGKVRKVTLSYRQLDNTNNYIGGALTNIERPVQNLVVILPAEDNPWTWEGGVFRLAKSCIDSSKNWQWHNDDRPLPFPLQVKNRSRSRSKDAEAGARVREGKRIDTSLCLNITNYSLLTSF